MPLDNRRAARLLDAGQALSSELALDILLQRTVELAADLTDARYGALGLVREERIVDFLTTGVSHEERSAIGDLPHGRGLLGALIETGRPLRLPDIAGDPRSVGFPPNHPPMRSFLGAPIRAGGVTYGNLYLTEKRGGGDFTSDDEEAVLILASQAGIAMANASLYRDARLRERWLEVIRDIGYLILAGTPSEAILAVLARQTRDLAGSDMAMVLTPSADGEHLEIVAADGARAAAVAGMRVPIEGSMSGRVLREAAPHHVASPSTTPGLYPPMVEAAYMGPTMFLPLRSTGAAAGVLVVSRGSKAADFADEEVLLLESFGAQAALALEYGRAQQELRRLELVADRERIARELHDGVIQALFAVGLGLQGAAALDDETAAARIEQAVTEIDAVIADLRRYIFGLRPGILSSGALADALEHLCSEAQRRTGVTTVLDVDVGVEVAVGDRQSDIVQLVREALSNVGRHAAATTCRVSLRRDGSHAIVEVDDDGRGFDPRTAAGGMGLGNMRSRAAAIDADLEIETEPGRGTCLRIRLPLSPAR